MKEHIMQNGDIARLKRAGWITGGIVEILDCTSPAQIRIRILSLPEAGGECLSYSMANIYRTLPMRIFPIEYDRLDVVSDPEEVIQLEAEICLKNL